jgi:hypothetical protein
MSELAIIFQVWGQSTGYVSMPRKDMVEGTWEEQSFLWPEDKPKIQAWIQDSVKKKSSLYWCPTVMTGGQRIKANIPYVNMLYADLDEADPRRIKKNLRPSIAWESSPGRFQALWLLEEPLPSGEAEQLNKNLTYYVGADKGGWDITQVLRIPGLPNHKYKDAPKSKLLWATKKTFSPVDFIDVPEVDTVDVEEIDGDIELTHTLNELLYKYIKKLKPRVYELLFTPEENISVGDRSERLWELESLLVEAGVNVEDAAQIVKLSPWNKFKGRSDEDKRILTELSKVDVKHSPTNDRPKTWSDYSQLMGMELDSPGWLIEGVWQKASHGMISGEPKTYKSTIVTEIAASVATGKSMWGKYKVHTTGPVLYIQEENSPFIVKDRLAKIANAKGALSGKVTYISSHEIEVKFPPVLPIHFLNNLGFDLTVEEDRQLLEEKIKEVKPVLIILDPLYLMLGGADENSAKELRPTLNWLLKVKYTYNTAIMILHHWNKGGMSARGGQRMLGSATLHGWVESAIYTKVVDEEAHRIQMEHEFRSFSKPPSVEVQFDLGDPGQMKYKVSLDNTVGVLELVSKGPGKNEKELIKETGLDKKTIERRLAKLERDGAIVKEGDIWKAVKVEVKKSGQSKEKFTEQD